MWSPDVKLSLFIAALRPCFWGAVGLQRYCSGSGVTWKQDNGPLPPGPRPRHPSNEMTMDQLRASLARECEEREAKEAELAAVKEAMSRKQEPPRVVIQPGDIGNSWDIPIHHDIEKRVQGYEYIPYTAFQPGYIHQEEGVIAVNIVSGTVKVPSLSLDRLKELDLGKLQWTHAASIVEGLMLKFHGEEVASAWRKHHEIVRSIGITHNNWKIALIYDHEVRSAASKRFFHYYFSRETVRPVGPKHGPKLSCSEGSWCVHHTVTILPVAAVPSNTHAVSASKATVPIGAHPAAQDSDPRKVVTPINPIALHDCLVRFGLLDDWSHMVTAIRNGFDVSAIMAITPADPSHKSKGRSELLGPLALAPVHQRSPAALKETRRIAIPFQEAPCVYNFLPLHDRVNVWMTSGDSKKKLKSME
ncbi:hypothetical protein C8J56DRAFT_1020171 [Mycena floridula]|nr:hypothetical protein C8J56DRAFT_1020171 [Mycena floridula]